jgi:hypothetical protein
MPPRFAAWHHEELVGALKRKAVEIEALRERLAESLERLHGVIETIESKPEGLSCEDNAKRVMSSFHKESATSPKTRRASRRRSS